ncbi:MAG: triose-phosphate isomerase [Chlamydiales bacterium]
MAQTSDVHRPIIITANWKMYKTIEEAKTFIKTLASLTQQSQATIYLAVPFTIIQAAVNCAKEHKIPMIVGAQNMNDASEGAFTGEIAARMLIEVGAQFVLLGHSERRLYFHESNLFINRKIKRALKESLQPVLCVGETLDEREAGETEMVIKTQLLQSLEGVNPKELLKLIIAYEPVWAIGTGKNADPIEAQLAHKLIRQVIREEWGEEVAMNMVIQYGGSVKPDNVSELIHQPDIDGLLIGGASLSIDSFIKIIHGVIPK